MNLVEEETETNQSDFEDDICHWTCDVCWPVPEQAEVALCGTNVKGTTYTPGYVPPDEMCAMCTDVMYNPCFKCGKGGAQ